MLVLLGAVLLVPMKWAATAILVTVFLMATFAQRGVAEADIPFDDPGISDGSLYDPDINIDSPSLYPEEIYQETSIPIEVSVNPLYSSRRFVDIYYSLDGGSNITLSIITYETSSGIFGKGPLDNLTDGYHTVEAYSTDTEGNTISSSTTFLVNTTIGFPTFLLSPKNTTYSSKEIPLTYIIDYSKYDAVSYSIDNTAHMMLDGNTTLPELSEGQHTITVRAVDFPTGLYSKQTVNFTIDTTSPTPTSSPTEEPEQ